jgi:uncharacterized protein YukE
MADPFGFGDPHACERAAAECERAARQLDGPISRLTSLRGTAVDAWRGSAGDSLVAAVDTRRQALVSAQGQLRAAASRLRTAAAQIRAAIRSAERARQNRSQPGTPLPQPSSPLDLAV